MWFQRRNYITALFLALTFGVCYGAERNRINMHAVSAGSGDEGAPDMSTVSTSHEARRKRDADKQGEITDRMVNDGLRKVRRMFNLMDDGDELVIKDEITTSSGTRRVRLKQTFRGLRVFGVSSAVELDELGQPTGNSDGHVINGIKYDVLDVENTVIDSADAVDILQAIYHPNRDNFIIRKPETEKVIYIKDDWTAAVCWFVNYLALDRSASKNHSRPHGIIDAHTGDVIESWEGLDTLQLSAVAGNEKRTYTPKMINMNLDEIDPGICFYKSTKVELMDLENTTPGEHYLWKVRGMPCHAVNDSLYFDYSNGGFSPMNEIYLYSVYTHDMFMSSIERAPLGNATESRIIRAKAHVNQCYDNAFWDGEYINIGDGCSFFYPLSSVDVIAHEIAHGFTTWTSGLLYTGQSGAINEAFSDMAGEATEYFYRQSTGQGTNDWRIGDEITKNPYQPLRYIDEPTNDGQSISHVDQYTDAYHQYVHYSSGIYNKAFYNLARSPGWGVINAFKVFATANLIEWEEDTTFHCAACGAINAARYLGYNTYAVEVALSSVGAICNEVMCL